MPIVPRSGPNMPAGLHSDQQVKVKDRNHLLAINGGANAHVQAWLLRAAGAFTRHFGFRGMQRYAYLLNRCFRCENSAVIALARGGVLTIYLGDGYWANLVTPDFLYEPEVGFVLTRALQQGNVFFFDCGANIGHWSAIAAAIIHKPGQVVAIEASPPCFEQLQQNARLNDESFQCIMRAVWSSDSEDLVIVTHERRHAGSSIVNRRDKRGQRGYCEYVVQSITLDSLCMSYVKDTSTKVIIKLDVEGAEIPALVGAKRLLQDRETLVVYEDHLQDPESKTSDYVLRRLGYDVYYCTEKCNIVRMTALSDIQHVKADARGGCNFFACSPMSTFSRMFDEMTHKGSNDLGASRIYRAEQGKGS